MAKKSKRKKKLLSHKIAAGVSLTKYKLFGGATIRRIDAVRIHDVGQGDCISLIEDGDVVMYVDYGGLFNHPDKANNYQNVKTMFPVANDIPIVLTHWDWDHYNSANHNQDAKDDARWLVPRQLVGPNAVKFANKLNHVRCWPRSVGSTPCRFSVGKSFDIRIEKCAPSPKSAGMKEDRNLTGLAITVLHTNGQGKTDEYVLLPGDAPYNKIPSIKNSQGTCLGMTAYHHGSHRHWTQATTVSMPQFSSTGSQALVYSYGENNTYHHPDRSNYFSWSSVEEETPVWRTSGRQSIDIVFVVPASGQGTPVAVDATVENRGPIGLSDAATKLFADDDEDSPQSPGTIEFVGDDDGNTWLVINGFLVPVQK